MAQISVGATKNVVLVHGGFVDGSGWEEVYKILKRDGHNVSVVQNPTISLTGDAVSDGRISHWREDLNPIPLQEAIASVQTEQVQSAHSRG